MSMPKHLSGRTEHLLKYMSSCHLVINQIIWKLCHCDTLDPRVESLKSEMRLFAVVPELQVSQLCIGSGCSGETTENTTAAVDPTEQTVKTNELPISSDGRCTEEPESEEGVDSRQDERLQAIITLQQARARVMEESTASFEQVIRLLICTALQIRQSVATAVALPRRKILFNRATYILSVTLVFLSDNFSRDCNAQT